MSKGRVGRHLQKCGQVFLFFAIVGLLYFIQGGIWAVYVVQIAYWESLWYILFNHSEVRVSTYIDCFPELIQHVFCVYTNSMIGLCIQINKIATQTRVIFIFSFALSPWNALITIIHTIKEGFRQLMAVVQLVCVNIPSFLCGYLLIIIAFINKSNLLPYWYVWWQT